ncbi:CHAT domain-containing protein [Archangium gephyra]|uniref:CHAT domain-containing protein n=1 Tax=Archangium gephyra TaxID=48 RepID=UPI0035D488DC
MADMQTPPAADGYVELFQQTLPSQRSFGVYCLGAHDSVALSAGFLLTAGIARRADDGTAAFPRLYLLLPLSAGMGEESFRQEMAELARRFLEKHMSAEQAAVRVNELLPRLQLSMLDTWEVEALAERVRVCEPGSAVLVLDADRLYSPAVELPPAFVTAGRAPFGKALQLRVFEDVWVPRVVHTVGTIDPISESQGLHLVLWTGQHRPQRSEHVQRLEGTPVALFWSEAAQGTVLSDRAFGLAHEGKLDEAFHVCDGWANPIERALLKANCCELAGRAPQAFSCIMPLQEEILINAPSSRVLQIARWAFFAGRYEEGHALLEKALASPEIDESFFDQALDAAGLARDRALLDRVRGEMRRHFPHSRALGSQEAREHFLAGRYAEAVQLFSPLLEQGRGGDDDRLLWVIARHHQEGPLDYERLMREVREQVPALADAAAEHWFAQALKGGEAPERIIERALTHPWNARNASDASSTLLLGMERLFLAPGGGTDDQRLGLLWRALERVLDHLSAHPADYRRRLQLSKLLDPALSGSVLFQLVSFFALNAWPWWKGARPGRRREVKRMDQAHFPRILELVFGEAAPMSVVGMGTVPVDKLPCPPEEALAFFLWMLEHSPAGLQSGQMGSQQLAQVLHFALLFARVAGETDEDIGARAMAAGALCVNGDFRTARDLMETLLVGISPEDPSQRRRRAWIAFADFSLRAHSLPEALLALACANRCPPGLELEDDLFVESRLWIRILRELKLFQPALALVSEARTLLHRLGVAERNLHHIDQLEASIRLLLLSQELTSEESGADPGVRTRFLALGELLADANRRAKATDGELQPGMLLLAQLIALGARFGLYVPEQVRREFDELLPDVGLLLEPLIRAVANKEALTPLLRNLGWGLEKVRDPEEVGRVVHPSEFMARQELGAAVDAGQAANALYLLEWSMDRALRNVDEAGLEPGSASYWVQRDVFEWVGRSVHGPGGGHIPEELTRLGFELGQAIDSARERNSSRQPPPVEECERFVLGLSHRGVAIHVLGLDEEQSLVRVSAMGGKLSALRETPEVFDLEALHAWQEDGYPAEYVAMDTRDPNGLITVERTLERIGISAESCGAAVLIPTKELQPVPPNLLLTGGNLAGTQMAIASAPSLTWLRAAHANPRAPTTRRGAWIPTSDSPEEQGTLMAMRDDIHEVLSAHGLVLSCASQPSESLARADIAFIGAHGSISPEGLFFRVVADERSARFSAHELARHVSGAGVVILAVCNGSRVDPHPFARATVGLARLLLGHGCRAVLGSPWSLDISVLRRWLPAFLARFDMGATVLEANHEANQTVAERFNRHPFHSLAMNLLGDPFVTR